MTITQLLLECAANNSTELNIDRTDWLTDDTDTVYVVRELLGKCHSIKTLICSAHYNMSDPSRVIWLLGHANLENITKLCLPGFGTELEGLDDSLSRFKKLRYLDLTRTLVTNTNFLKSFKALEILKISGNPTIDLNDIAELTKLTLLDVTACGFTTLAPLYKLTQLKALYASGNSIASIEPLKNCKHIDNLDISSNYKISLDGLNELNLEYLNISHIGFNDLGELVKETNIKHLVASGSKTNSLNFPYPSQLQSLHLVDSAIFSIGRVEGLKNLIELNLSKNFLNDISPLSRLTKLTRLSVRENQLISLNGIEALLTLEKLDVSSNHISDIEIAEALPRLENFRFYNNPLRSISKSLFSKFGSKLYTPTLGSIRELEIASAGRTDLGDIQKIHALEGLIKKNTKLDSGSLKEYYRLVGQYFFISKELETPSIQAMSDGPEAISAFYQNLEVSELIPFREGKIVLLGEPDAGKTNLLNYFIGIPFQKEKSVTRGVNIQKLRFQNAGNDYQINFWDFGGQEVQQSVHQYFLTDNTLYLIILNAVTDEQPEKYLQFLNNHAPNSPFIIITNKDDLNGVSKIKNNQISNDYRDRRIGSEFRVSLMQASAVAACKGDENLYRRRNKDLQRLFDQIKLTFLGLPHIDQGFISTYMGVKRLVEDVYEMERKPYITMNDFVKYCNSEGVVEGTEVALLSQLNFIGTVRYIDETNLRGLHILNPEWLSDGIYRIITDGNVRSIGRGQTNKQEIIRILRPNSSSEFIYREDEIDFIVTMMQHFNVAYYDQTDKQIYLPELFPDDIPSDFDKRKFIDKSLHYFFSYDTEIPSYIISRLIVKLFEKVKQDQYWNKGIVIETLESPNNPCEALIEQNDRVIDIWVRGKDCQSFFLMIRDALRASHAKAFNAFKEMIDLGRESVPYQTIMTYKLHGEKRFKGSLADPKTGEIQEYLINDILGRFEPESVKKGRLQKASSNLTINTNGGNFINQGAIGEGNDSITSKDISMGSILPDYTSIIDLTMADSPEVISYKAKKLKVWKRNAWIALLSSITIGPSFNLAIESKTICTVLPYQLVDLINSFSFKVGKWGFLAIIWYVTSKVWYDRIMDKSKENAFLYKIR